VELPSQMDSEPLYVPPAFLLELVERIKAAHSKVVNKVDGWEKVKLPLTIVHPRNHSSQVFNLFTKHIGDDFADEKIWGRPRSKKDENCLPDYLDEGNIHYTVSIKV
jgi:hypothetical protein